MLLATSAFSSLRYHWALIEFSCAAHGEGLSHKSTGELVMNDRFRPDDVVWIVPCVFTPLKSACVVPCVFVGRYQPPKPPSPHSVRHSHLPYHQRLSVYSLFWLTLAPFPHTLIGSFRAWWHSWAYDNSQCMVAYHPIFLQQTISFLWRPFTYLPTLFTKCLGR